MLPTIQLGPIALPTYPLLLLLGFYLGLWLAAKIGARRGISPDLIYNAGFYAAVAAVIAGRLGHVIRYLPAYLSDPLSILTPNLAAFQPLVAAFAAFAVIIWYQRKYEIPVRPLLDAFTVGSLLTLAILAFADGLNGRSFGEATNLPWAIQQWETARHPVQFYESLGLLIIIGFIWRYLDRLQTGEAALAAIGGFAAVRLIVDAFRAQPAILGDGFRLTQVLAFAVLLVVMLAFFQLRTTSEQD